MPQRLILYWFLCGAGLGACSSKAKSDNDNTDPVDAGVDGGQDTDTEEFFERVEDPDLVLWYDCPYRHSSGQG